MAEVLYYFPLNPTVFQGLLMFLLRAALLTRIGWLGVVVAHEALLDSLAAQPLLQMHFAAEHIPLIQIIEADTLSMDIKVSGHTIHQCLVEDDIIVRIAGFEINTNLSLRP